jgi:hypothetical protein
VRNVEVPPVGVREGERAQDHRIDHAVHAGDRADGEGQRPDTRHEESRRPQQRSPGVFQVSPRVFELPEALAMIEPILGHAHIAEVAARHALGVRGAHSLRLEAIHLDLQVGANLVLEIFL